MEESDRGLRLTALWSLDLVRSLSEQRLKMVQESKPKLVCLTTSTSQMLELMRCPMGIEHLDGFKIEDGREAVTLKERLEKYQLVEILPLPKFGHAFQIGPLAGRLPKLINWLELDRDLDWTFNR